MCIRKIALMLLCFVLPVHIVFAEGDENIRHILWDKTPIPVQVTVGKERRIEFPEAIRITNSDPGLTTKKVDFLNNDGNLYIHAKEAFEPVRLLIELSQSSQVILLDLSAVNSDKGNVDNTPLSIVLPNTQNTIKDNQNDQGESVANFVNLIRYAIAQAYTQLRVSALPKEVYRTPMRTQATVKLFFAEDLLAYPIASWHQTPYYVTAVELSNTAKEERRLDPRHIIGDWKAVTFFPRNRLGKLGSPTQHTTCFLISTIPFQEALVNIPLMIRQGVQ